MYINVRCILILRSNYDINVIDIVSCKYIKYSSQTIVVTFSKVNYIKIMTILYLSACCSMKAVQSRIILICHNDMLYVCVCSLCMTQLYVQLYMFVFIIFYMWLTLRYYDCDIHSLCSYICLRRFNDPRNPRGFIVAIKKHFFFNFSLRSPV